MKSIYLHLLVLFTSLRLFLSCYPVNPVHLHTNSTKQLNRTSSRKIHNSEDENNFSNTKARTWAAISMTTRRGNASRIHGRLDSCCWFAICNNLYFTKTITAKALQHKMCTRFYSTLVMIFKKRIKLILLIIYSFFCEEKKIFLYYWFYKIILDFYLFSHV